jgi:phosphate ABC transporter permease subunit PstA
MSVAVETARRTVALTASRGRDRNAASIVFVSLLWFALFFGIVVLLVLIADTLIKGSPRFDGDLVMGYESTIAPETTGFRAGIIGTAWLMFGTALFAVPLGVGAGLYLEEFSDQRKWYNRLIEVNLQNLAAVPSIVYGLLAVAVMALLGFQLKNLVLGGAIALALLILPVVIITTREAVRAVPTEIRHASLALGATPWQTTWRQTLPAAVPGIATGTILGLSRAIGEAAPLLLLGIGAIRFDPNGFLSQVTALPVQIYRMATQSQVEYQQAASAGIIVLLVMILGLNAVAIFIRNKFQRSW